jgi:hypothetical protein
MFVKNELVRKSKDTGYSICLKELDNSYNSSKPVSQLRFELEPSKYEARLLPT